MFGGCNQIQMLQFYPLRFHQPVSETALSEPRRRGADARSIYL